MRDNILKRAIIISIVVHVIAICCIGFTSSSRMGAAARISAPQRMIDVDLVKDPLADPPTPKPIPIVTPTRMPDDPSPTPTWAASNPGGALNTGTASANGDINAGASGRTPVGWVPGNDSGRGQGSGSSSGVEIPAPARPDPPRQVDPPRHIDPPPPPMPRRVTVRVCEATNLLAGDNCKATHNQSFNEGDEPRRTCDRCKAPEPEHKSRLADHNNPIMKHDVSPRVPDSVDEGDRLQVEIEYWVEKDGSVSGVRVVRSSGNRDFDRAVCSAAAKYGYEPAVQDGEPQRVKMTRPVKY